MQNTESMMSDDHEKTNMVCCESETPTNERKYTNVFHPDYIIVHANHCLFSGMHNPVLGFAVWY